MTPNPQGYPSVDTFLPFMGQENVIAGLDGHGRYTDTGRKTEVPLWFMGKSRLRCIYLYCITPFCLFFLELQPCLMRISIRAAEVPRLSNESKAATLALYSS